MPRGGRREGAGSKPTWKHGKTKTVRVPEALADKILGIAKVLDDTESIDLQDLGYAPEEVKVIDLTGVAIHAHTHGAFVYLSDLIRIGYTIKPERLVRNLRSTKPVDNLLEGIYE
jgi:hypothetical protein